MRRRVASSLVVPAGALLAMLAAVQALAQPATRPLNLRPAFEDTNEDAERRDREAAPKPIRREEPRPAGSMPNFETSQAADIPRYGNTAGFGAGATGFNSQVMRRRPGARREVSGPGTRRVPGTAQQPSLTGNRAGAATSILRSSTTGASAIPAISYAGASAAKPQAETPAAAAAPRNPLVRIPDGTPGGGLNGTVSTARMPSSAAALLRRRTAADDDPFAPVGLHPGAFIVLPAIETAGGYDTNPARSQNGRASSFVTVSPELIARSDWQRHEVTATLRGSYTAYDRTPEQDRPAFDGKVTGRFDVSRDTALIGEGSLIVGTDNPGSPNVQAGLSRYPIYTTLGGTFGVIQRFNRIEVTAKGIAERTEYAQSQFTDGTIGSNDDRNYNRFGGSLRTSYDLMPGLKPFVEFGADAREHDLTIDRFGFNRDSTGWVLKGGSTFEFSRKLVGEAAIGWINRTYADPTLQELNGFLFDASLIYSMSALTNIKLLATTTAGETTVPGTSGTLTRNVGFEVEHQFRRWLIGAVKFNYGLDDYVGSVRKDDRYSVSASLTYKLNRMASVKGEVRQEWLESTIPINDYSATVFLLGMRLQY